MTPTWKKNHLALAAAGVLTLMVGLSARADSTYQSVVMGDGPLTYYRFSETAVNPMPYPWATNSGTVGSAADGYDATGSGSPAIIKGVSGALADPANTAFQFPGLNNNRVVIPHLPEFAADGPFSVEFWAKPASADFASPGAMMKYWTSGTGCEDANRYGWLIYQSDTDLNLGNGWQIRLYKGSGTGMAGIAQMNMTIVPNTWYHVVAVYTGSAINLYVNGALRDSEAASGYKGVPFPAYPLTFGSRGYTGSTAYWEYRGVLDEVAVYTNVLSADDVAAHYGAATTNGTGYAAMILAHGPAGYWRFNEVIVPLPTAKNSGSGGTALDGTYQYYSTTVPELRSPPYSGFSATNQVLQLAASPNGYVSTPALAASLSSATFEGWI